MITVSRRRKDSRGKLSIQALHLPTTIITEDKAAINSIIRRNSIEMIIRTGTHNIINSIKTKGNTNQGAIRLNLEDSNIVGAITNIAKEEKVVMARTTNNTMIRRATSKGITTASKLHQTKNTDNIMINKGSNHQLQKAATTLIKNNKRNSMVKVSY